MSTEAKLDLARDKWRSSGLSDAHAKKLGFSFLTRRDTAFRYSRFADTASLFIPYFDAKGRKTKFYRLRRLEAPTGFDALTGKVQRYAQPPDSAPEVYLPPLGKRSWAEVLADPSQPIIVTEGELKAACATSMGFWTVGLGGVDSWRSRKKGIALLPVLAEAQWKGRVVTVVFDSDAATNPDVARACQGLGSELKSRGAELYVASLPPAKDGAKQGLDDLLVAGGAEALKAVLDEAAPLHESSPLWQLNEEVVFVWSPGLIVVRESSQKLSPDSFVRHHYANRRHEAIVDGKPKLVDTAKEWMRWPHRFSASKLTYEPGKPRMVDGCFNVWNGLGVEPEEGDVKPFLELVDFVLDGLDAERRKWFWQWCAYPLQHPGTKLYSCVALWSAVQGVGKSFIAYVLKDIYGENGIEIRNQDLGSSFNSYLEGRQFVVGDEITGSDARTFADQLKGLITQEQVRVNAKYVPEYVVPDKVNWFFTSQHPDAFYLDDTDRRFFVHHVKGSPKAEGFYRRLDEWRFKGNGPSHLLAYLLEVDLAGFNPKGHAPSTPSKEAMTYDAKSDVARWVSDLKNDPANILKLGEVAIEKDLFTPAELLALYDPLGSKGVKANGLGRELVKAFARLPKNATSAHGSQNLYAVRNEAKWLKATPVERARHWEAPSPWGKITREPKY